MFANVNWMFKAADLAKRQAAAQKIFDRMKQHVFGNHLASTFIQLHTSKGMVKNAATSLASFPSTSNQPGVSVGSLPLYGYGRLPVLATGRQQDNVE